MRKKQNYQRTEYAENGELICFGLSEHQLTENIPKLSEKAKKDMEKLSSYLNSDTVKPPRPAYKSDQGSVKETFRMQIRFCLGSLLLREMPFQSFVTRSVLFYFIGTYFVLKGLGTTILQTRPGFYY